ncbi:prepilin peptidase, partial [Oceanivirga salmonicida]|uniref:prepilin peptidase n=1 Tax=Oceanivirga salmonicida TaxID=1769291 RepID=UPI00082B6951
MIIFKILFNLFFLISVYEDIKKKIIPEFCIILMLIIAIINAIIYKNFSILYYSISIYCLPFYIIIIIETYLQKELIGLGDLKLMLAIGAYFSNTDLYFLNLYYALTYTIALISVIIFQPKEKYIPLAPMLYISYLI